ILRDLDVNLDKYRPDMVVAMMGVNDDTAAMRVAAHNPFFRLRTVRLLYWLRSLRLLTPAEGKGAAVSSGTAAGCRLEPVPDYECIEKLSESGQAVEMERIYRLIMRTGATWERETACMDLGGQLSEQGRNNEAEEVLLGCLRQSPTRMLYFTAGNVARLSNRYRQSERLLKKALSSPCSEFHEMPLGRVYKDLGLTYQAIGDESARERSLRKAVELEPENAAGRYLLAACLDEHGKKEEALLHFKKIAEQAPSDSPRAYQMAALLAEQKGGAGYAAKARSLELSFSPEVAANYRLLRDKLFRRGIALAAVQYPMRPPEQLKIMLDHDPRVLYVDNEALFKKVVAKEGYGAYFVDRFAGNFGHCTDKGNRLLGDNIAAAILKNLP
ncbi:MAG TPA: tetratricopeptide repeat protein, partial [Elusimicrobiales bacterium]|nr:tetratricopeptide repeat protein [Elusimicrobiales bacterium]